MDVVSLLELVHLTVQHNLWGILLLPVYHFSLVRPWVNEIKAMNQGYQKLVDERLGHIENDVKEIKTDLREWVKKSG